MEIIFLNSKLQKLCEQKALAQKKLGKVCTRKLQSRLTDLATVASVRELVAGRPHPLKGDRAGEFAIDLEGAKRLVFKPAHNPIPCNEDGSLDWLKVTRICIVFIGDYHD
ncbi:MAG: killer suppression protein HigA [Symploca sp. SIO3C6]|nr:killer suppression protein HigA [Symploca sp. SIO3C6]NET04438.1 killer suppression protein HigA [Symploca sp. SIO2B6]NET51937.1 killer suppression protein HigA [Merismopedia sp. SIO2A8]